MNSHEQRHRNAHLNDKALFDNRQLLKLQDAVYELCWLLNRGYARDSAMQLVADHHQINKLQRLVVSRAACSRFNREARKAKCLPIEKIKGRPLVIDGFNLIITVETAMAGGLLLRCCDGCIRDIASVHGTYRQVNETRQAIELIGNAVQSFAPESVLWLFDKPVSNSGRLAAMIRNIAEIQGWNWQAELVESPDQVISGSEKIAITSDSAILDRTLQWVNLGAYLMTTYFPEAWRIDFSGALDKPGQTTP
ncbi:conserved hypothetical protein [Candidatus Methylobacter favarea]|uniref:DUF434 domain-containing protein n=1 Tax=Candidatus Methylobacter favarea TaxID=2707345 RepID=A0A8S0WD06_9GAMM|nr:DUF434 domain-containing protein [Candidatus Methylobacter favarea]CAA9892885.1 conserved hypothetical protein [Candidatus Methylobacter favarea]